MSDKTLKARLVGPREASTKMLLMPIFAPRSDIGVGTVTVVCGACSLVLFQGAEEGTVKGIFIRCPSCGEVNDVTV